MYATIQVSTATRSLVRDQMEERVFQGREIVFRIMARKRGRQNRNIEEGGAAEQGKGGICGGIRCSVF